MDGVALFVSVPIAAFRAPYAREYLETLPCPPPATVYGMLLSLVGEENRRTHIGADVATAMLSEPALSTVIRTSWRLKTGAPQGTGGTTFGGARACRGRSGGIAAAFRRAGARRKHSSGGRSAAATVGGRHAR